MLTEFQYTSYWHSKILAISYHEVPANSQLDDLVVDNFIPPLTDQHNCSLTVQQFTAVHPKLDPDRYIGWPIPNIWYLPICADRKTFEMVLIF